MTVVIVAIDGHAGSGKSSLGRRLARELELRFVDTGAMYRAVALGALAWRHAHRDEPLDAERLVAELSLHFEPGPDGFRVFLGGQDVTERLRDREVGQMASVVAALAAVRRYVTERARAFRALGGLVVDGRDIGTVVFPEAEVKVFLTASPEVRARRRHEDTAGGRAETVEQTRVELDERDRADSSRTIAPLLTAPDAVVIDTTDLALDEAYERLRRLVRDRATHPLAERAVE